MPPKGKSALTMVGWSTNIIPVEICWLPPDRAVHRRLKHRATEAEGRIVGNGNRFRSSFALRIMETGPKNSQQ
jgi:hypothetical protein